MKKIILCTTFREFDGSENDKIQRLFLKSIQNQTYKNFLVVATTFGEKKVKDVLTESFKEKCIVKDITLEKYRFSLTDVILNALDEADNLDDDCIIIWCTCDLILEDNLFSVLAENYSDNLAGLIHPNIIYKDVTALDNNEGTIGSLQQGIDILFFSSKLLREFARNDIAEYRFYNWGVFELFLVAIAKKYSCHKLNFYPISKVKKIENDRLVNNETDEYRQRCMNMNFPVLERFVKDKDMNDDFVRDLFICHKYYKPIKLTKAYMWMYIKFVALVRVPRTIKLIGLRLFKKESYYRITGKH